jgi:hypothetical protein
LRNCSKKMDRGDGRQGKVMGKVVSSHFHLFTYPSPCTFIRTNSHTLFCAIFSIHPCQVFLVCRLHNNIPHHIRFHLTTSSSALVISHLLYSIPSPIFTPCLGCVNGLRLISSYHFKPPAYIAVHMLPAR